MDKNQEIIELIINGKDEYSDVSEEVRKELFELQDSAAETQREFNRLNKAIDLSDTFKEQEAQLNQLVRAQAESRAEVVKLTKANRAAGESNIELASKTAKAKAELASLRASTNKAQKAFDATAASIKKYGINVDDVRQNQSSYRAETEKLGAAITELNQQQTAIVRTSQAEVAAKKESIIQAKLEVEQLRETKKQQRELYAVQKETRKETKSYAKDIIELVSQLKKGNIEWSEFESRQKKAASASKLNRTELEAVNRALVAQSNSARETGQVERTRQLTAATVEYRKQLDELVDTYRQGNTSAGAFTRAEKDIRDSLNLSEAQTRETRKALGAYSDDLNKLALAEKKASDAISATANAEKESVAATRLRAEESKKASSEIQNYALEMVGLITQLKKGTIEWRDYQRQVSLARETSKASRADIAQVNKDLESQIVNTRRYREELKNRAVAEKEAIRQAKLKADIDAAAANNTEQVKVSTAKYRVELAKLIAKYKEGEISAKQFARAEKDIRSSLKLTEDQARETRRELNAYADQMERSAGTDLKKSKSTDVLTQSTRRLAQGYTVLLAAQKAISAVGQGIEQYKSTEEAMLSLKKTTGLTTGELQDFREEMTSLANSQTATVRNELIGIAEAAGRMGIRGSENLTLFTKSIDALQSATDLTSESASTAVARILELSGESQDSISNIASAISALGQNVAASESEIVHFAQRLASTTAEAELSAAEILGLSASLAGMGMQAEGASNVIGRTFREISGAIQGGGEELDKLSALMGMSGDALADAFSNNKTKFLSDFIASIKNATENGQTLNGVLESMGLSSDENARVLGTLVKQYESLNTTLDISNKGFESGVEHFKEASIQAASLSDTLERTRNQYNSLISVSGEAFSDDIIERIELTDQQLVEFEKAAADVSELLADLIGVVFDVGRSFIGFHEAMESVFPVLKIMSLAVNSVELSFLALSSGLSTLEATLYKSAEGWAYLTGRFDDAKVYAQKAKDAIDDVAESSEKMGSVVRVAAGDSSRAYEDLLRVYEANKDGLDSMDESQRAALETIVNSTGYVEGSDKAYRLLIESIRQSGEAARIFKGYTNEQNVALNASIEILQATGKTLEEATKIAKAELRVKQEKIELLETEKQATELTTIATGQLTIAQVEQIEASVEAQKSADELRGRLEGLTAAELENEIAVTKAKDRVQEKKRALNETAIGTDSYTIALRELILAEKELAEIEDGGNELFSLKINNIYSATAAYEKYTKVIDDFNSKAQSGATITQQDIDKRTEAQAILSSLENTYGDLSTAVENDTEKTKDNTDEVDKNTEARKKNSTAHKVMIQLAGKSANEWQNASAVMASAYEKLIVKMQDSQKHAAQISGTLRGYIQRWKQAYNSMQRDAQDLSDQFDRQTKSAARLSEELDDVANLTKEQVDSIEDSVEGLSKLDDSTLNSLRSQIASVRAEMDGLTESANDALNALKDEVDGLTGDDEAIEKRDYDERLDELQELKEQAKAQGNSDAVSDLSESIKLLKEAHRLRMAELAQAAQDKAVDEAQAQQESTQTNNNAARTITVNLNGQAREITVTDQTSEAELIAMFEELEEVTA